MNVILLTERAAPALFPAAHCVVVKAVEELERHRDADLYVDLDFTMEAARLSALSRLLPALVMVNAVTTTIGEIGHPFMRINGWPGLLERTVHEVAVPDPKAAEQVVRLYEKLGSSLRIVPDIPGMITARMLADHHQ